MNATKSLFFFAICATASVLVAGCGAGPEVIPLAINGLPAGLAGAVDLAADGLYTASLGYGRLCFCDGQSLGSGRCRHHHDDHEGHDKVPEMLPEIHAFLPFE